MKTKGEKEIKKRQQIIQGLRDNRFTYQYISNLLGVSRQRIQQIEKINVKEREEKREKKKEDIKNGLRPNTIGINRMKLGGRDFIREAVRRRDNHTCQICGKKWVEGKRRFDIHHIDCDKEKTHKYDNWKKEKDNMITLCHKCHMNLPEHKNVMSKGWGKNSVNQQKSHR